MVLMEAFKAFKKGKRKLFSLTSIPAKIIRLCSSTFNFSNSEAPISYSENDMDKYLNMLGNNSALQSFFKTDACCCLADKYLIAMVFNYFIRAGYSQIQYTAYNFFVALYLAHDMEEDEEEPKNELFCWALGNDWSDQYREFLKSRDDLWRALGHRSVVSLSSCEKVAVKDLVMANGALVKPSMVLKVEGVAELADEAPQLSWVNGIAITALWVREKTLTSLELIMSIRPEHWAWQRFRPEVHAGANRSDTHSFCQSELLRSHWNCCPLKEAINSTASETSTSSSSIGDQEPDNSSVKRSREE